MPLVCAPRSPWCANTEGWHRSKPAAWACGLEVGDANAVSIGRGPQRVPECRGGVHNVTRLL
jgi:hypothetical protein